MKLSMAWIFEHIGADLKTVDVPALIEKFNRTTAEIESYEKVSVDLNNYALAQVQSIDANCIVLLCPENHQEFVLPLRNDAKKGRWYLVKKDRATYRWVQPTDFGKDKEGLLPEFHVDSHLADGGWKKQIDVEDYILDIDNKSITNRPDLWCHRGFAREFAAILNVPFEPLDKYIKKVDIDQHESKAQGESFSIEINTPECRRFAGLYVDQVLYRPSSLWMGLRLLRVGVSAISFYVDITNYVMLDISEPMHAFDAGLLSSRSMGVRMASNNEKFLLLDDTELNLTDQDMVVTDGDKIVSLAGIMGGKETAISNRTHSLFFEAANFDATTIRRSATRHKIRTESSMRFEKSLDLNQNIIAIERALKLMDDERIEYRSNNKILSVGAPAHPSHVKVTHDFIEKRLGVKIDSGFIEGILTKLQFGVVANKSDNKITYEITIPTFRATKDINLQEDIVEEIGRFWGYEKIPYILPTRQMSPSDNTMVTRKQDIKNHMAFALQMREVNNYPVYDESWLSQLKYKPSDGVQLRNPLSENAQQMATSLIPHMLRNIEQNKVHYNELRFFELGRRWWMSGLEPNEQKTLAGLFWSKEKTLDFYQIKDELNSLFMLLHLPIKWVKAQGNLAPWYSQHQTAFLMHDNKTIGIAGIAKSEFLAHITEGTAFIVELNADFLLSYTAPTMKYTPLSKYPYVWLDVSLLSPIVQTVDDLEKTIKNADNHIYKVELKDSFRKKEWHDKQALTIRFYIRDQSKTLNKQDIDAVYDRVVQAVQKRGVEVR
ncbi:phenylalanine--tRNA ligase subunit beta [candidate division TM6 bacterium RIFCSPHIGHO2_12_FULL_36_22]|nr:MAG: phenylalanine--tRNA ligase subunit beta [candidate division TM6 bacterium RIFCSPHIGHO2_12_FULL_36_22]